MSRARDLADGNFSGDLEADSPTFVVDSANNRVGIGTASPSTELHVAGDATIGTDTGGILNVKGGSSTSSQIRFFDGGTGRARIGVPTGQTYLSLSGSDTLTADVAIDSSGNLLVGTTNSSIFNASSGTGMVYRSGVALDVAREATASGQPCINLNMTGTDGDHIIFYKDGVSVGSIGIDAGYLNLGMPSGSIKFGPAENGQLVLLTATGSGAPRLAPWYDNTTDLGAGAQRYDDIYATNGTIQTSDINDKQDIEALSDAEQRVAVAAKGLLRKYRWKDAVAEKGDEARIHFGIIAQDLQAAFEAEGLDAGRYGMFISSTWWEAERVIPAVEAQDAVYETQLDEDGNEVQVLVSEAIEAQPERVVTDTFDTLEEAPEGAVQRTRLGVRYPELLAFIIAAL